MDEEETEPPKDSSEEDDIRGGEPEFLQFMSERKDFLHDFLRAKISTIHVRKKGFSP